jgi:hypothetical protein
VATEPGEHRGVDVDRGDLVTGPGQRDSEAARARGELEDGSVGAGREGEVQGEVAGVLDEVDVIEAGERVGLGLLAGAYRARGQCYAPGTNRTGRPAAFLTASALIASSATRFATIAVVSAWS